MSNNTKQVRAYKYPLHPNQTQIAQDDNDIDLLATWNEVADGMLERYPLTEREKAWLNGDKYGWDAEGYKRRSARYRRKYPQRIRARAINYRARDKTLKGKDLSEALGTLYSQQKGRCWWCGKKVENNYHIDHRIPLAKGGSNDLSNLVVSCPKCNFAKGDKMPDEFKGRHL